MNFTVGDKGHGATAATSTGELCAEAVRRRLCLSADRLQRRVRYTKVDEVGMVEVNERL